MMGHRQNQDQDVWQVTAWHEYVNVWDGLLVMLMHSVLGLGDLLVCLCLSNRLRFEVGRFPLSCCYHFLCQVMEMMSPFCWEEASEFSASSAAPSWDDMTAIRCPLARLFASFLPPDWLLMLCICMSVCGLFGFSSTSLQTTVWKVVWIDGMLAFYWIRNGFLYRLISFQLFVWNLVRPFSCMFFGWCLWRFVFVGLVFMLLFCLRSLRVVLCLQCCMISEHWNEDPTSNRRWFVPRRRSDGWSLLCWNSSFCTSGCLSFRTVHLGNACIVKNDRRHCARRLAVTTLTPALLLQDVAGVWADLSQQCYAYLIMWKHVLAWLGVHMLPLTLLLYLDMLFVQVYACPGVCKGHPIMYVVF